MDANIIFVKVSNERSRELAVTTKIYEEENGERFAVKYATYAEGKAHISHIYEAYHDLKERFVNTDIEVLPCEKWNGGLRFPYISGETAEDRVNGMIERGAFEEARTLIQHYLELIRSVYQEKSFEQTPEFQRLFGDVDLPGQYQCGVMNNIDMVLDNFVLEENKTYLFDYEWTFSCPVPLEYMLYRILHYFVYRNKRCDELIAHGFMSLVEISEAEKRVFDTMEHNFQKYVTGDCTPIRELYGKVGAKAINVFSNEEKLKMRIYYDRGAGFSERDVVEQMVSMEGDYLEANIEVPTHIRAIRFDPIENKYSLIRLLSLTDEKGMNLLHEVKSNGILILGIWYFLDVSDPWFMVKDAVGKVHIRYQLTIVEEEERELYAQEMKYIRARRNSKLRKCARGVKKSLHIAKYMTKHVMKHGIRGIRTAYRNMDKIEYHHWFLANRITTEEQEIQRDAEKKFAYRPKISVLVPVYRTPIPVLREMIESVCNQTYSNFELCIADGSMGDDALEDTILQYHNKDARVVYRKLDENSGISGNTNAALSMATGEYVGLLDHDDLLEPDALYEVVSRLQQQKYDILYTDEDKVNEDSTKYMDPNFKPDFSMDLFCSHNYITHFFVVKKSIIDSVGGFRSEYDGSQDYDVMFRCIEQSKDICHIPKILYHWRMITGSTADNPASKMYCYEAGRKAIESHLQRVGLDGTVTMTDMWGIYHTVYKVVGDPLVSIVIANKDLADTLDQCIRSVEEKSTYRQFEIIIVENNSTENATFAYYEKIQKEYSNVHVVTWEKEFNYSAINNYGVAHAKGEYILLLNNDTEMITPTAIEEMLGICCRKEVGIVGAKLLYPDDTVQHAGVVVGFGGYAGHVFHGIPRHDLGYMMRPMMNCNYSAVTAACLMVKHSVFDEVGGLTEIYKVACNDIDFCLKVREKGYLVVYNAFSEWYHYESKSRGYEDTPEKMERFQGEVRKFQARWGEFLEQGDPYYNSNFPITGEPFTL